MSFSKFQCSFQKGINAQHCLLAMIEKWRKTLDKSRQTGTVLTDLSKTFDCIYYNLLIAKLNANRYERQSIDLLHSSLIKFEQKTEINSAYSLWEMFF